MMTLLLALLPFPAVNDGASLDKTLARIGEESLRVDVGRLADDAFEGRAAGFPGAEKAAEYIAGVFRERGLKPGGADGTFFQSFVFSRRKEQFRARNVLALVEGTDPERRGELVVVGAHYDHVGRLGQNVGGQGKDPRNPDDEIWNGADDNGSGTSCVMALARAFGDSGFRPRRSVMFALWCAEEAGLLGSKHWCANPTWPGKVVFNLNMDMVGRNGDRPMDLEGLRTSLGDTITKLATGACDREGLSHTPFEFQNHAVFRTDSASFLRASIPSINFFTYWHADYHKNGDHAEKLDYPRMARIARTAARIVAGVADLDAVPAFNPDTPLSGRYRKLGFTYEAVTGDALSALGLGKGRGAARVTKVVDGSAASAAGLRAGDLVTGFRGKPFEATNLGESIRGTTLGAKTDTDYDLHVIRDGAPLALKIRWEK